MLGWLVTDNNTHLVTDRMVIQWGGGAVGDRLMNGRLGLRGSR